MQFLANAKINIGLNVIGCRRDGYHDIETVFYPVKSLCDRLTIEKVTDKDDIFLEETGVWGVGGEKESNLITRVYRRFQSLYKIGGVKIGCEKNIPYGAGLGGGSADAAFTALTLNELFALNLDRTTLKDIVAPMGADCAFFLENRPCFAEGVGERLTPIALPLEGYSLVLVKPAESVSTKEAYAGVRVQAPLRSLREWMQTPVSSWCGNVVNDFEDSVFAAHPRIARVKGQLYESGAVYASMSGSGATVYSLFAEHEMPSQEELKQTFPDCFIHFEPKQED